MSANSAGTLLNATRNLRERAKYYGYAARARVLRQISGLAAASGKRKVLILDPGLIGYFGHHAELTQILKSTLSPRFDVRVYANFRVDGQLALQLGAHPIFYETIYPPRSDQDFRSVNTAMTRSLVSGLGQIDTEDLSPTALAVMHTAMIFQLDALAEWISKLPVDRRPTLVIVFHAPLEFGVRNADWLMAVSHAKRAAGVLKETGRVQFASVTDRLSSRIADQLGYPCTTLPVPLRWLDVRDAAITPLHPAFGFFGGLRLEKGAGLLADALPGFAALHKDVRFVIHAPPEESDEAASRSISQAPGVSLLRTTFKDKRDYFKKILSVGCVLLPYDPASYAMRASGVLLEALAFGRMVITTKGTWLEEQVHKWRANSFVMSKFSADELTQCMAQARIALLSSVEAPHFDHEVVSKNNSDSFSAAVMSLVGD